MLPAGSFDTSGIATAGTYFFYYFNYNGHITSVPASFTLPALTSVPDNALVYLFNSPNYAIDRNAPDILNGCATPPTKRFTFSSNQPGYSSLPANWQD
jgi:hypothetical protein